jgi:hypothetical protein
MDQAETSREKSGPPASGATLTRIKWVLAVILLGPMLGTVIHEAAHLFMLWFTGSTVHQVVIFGSLQLWPAPAIIENTGAGFMLNTTNPDEFSRGMVLVTGAAATFVVSLAAIAVWLRTRSPVALIFVGYSLDLITYLSLPSLGVRRWVLFGAPYSEVLEGLSVLGVGKAPVALFELCFIAAMAALFLGARKRRLAMA